MSDITKIKVDGEPESSYQLYPRNEEFAKRGAQPDWNQNDDTQPDYVKNRPFYTGDPVETVLFNESFVFTIIGMGPMGERGIYNGVTDFSPEIGQTYQVSWDGAVYSCVGTEYNSLIALGNLSIMNFGSDTGEPFLITCGTGSINIYTWPAHSSHTISIGKMVVPVVKIDPKYLVHPDWNQNDSNAADFVKNRPFYSYPVENVIVEESTVSFADDGGGIYFAPFPSAFEAIVGETYKVYWDGAAYECACVNFINKPVIGNLSIMGADPDTGEPFAMNVNNGEGIGIVTTDTSASHTFSISVFAPEVVKIDPKYLPSPLQLIIDATNLPTNNSEWRELHEKIDSAYNNRREILLNVYGDNSFVLPCVSWNNGTATFIYAKNDFTNLCIYILTAFTNDGGNLVKRIIAMKAEQA